MPNASDSDLYDPIDGKPEFNAPVKKPMVIQIVAMTEDGMIGKNNDLPWGHWKEDLQFFKETTIDSVMVMGFNTVLSIPKKLPNRFVYGLTDGLREIPAKSLEKFYSIAEGLVVGVGYWINDIIFPSHFRNDVIFIAGGGQTYRDTMSQTNVIYQNIIIPDEKINVEQEDKIVYYPIHQLENYFTCISSVEVSTAKGKMVKKIWVKNCYK